jgi:hypothetical protein
MSFASAEARATAAIFRRFPNAQASFLHTGVITPVVGNVVFDAAYAVVDEFDVVVNRPALLKTPDVAPLTAEGDSITLTRLDDAATALGVYKVRAVLPVAEGGYQRVTLAKA